MADEDVLKIMIRAMFDANMKYSDTGHGTTRDNIWRPREDTSHLAQAVLDALRSHGYDVLKKEEDQSEAEETE